MAYNPVEAAEALQSIDQQTLNTYMKNPPPGIPAYQVAAEVARRADMAKRFAALQAKERTDQQTGTVIEDVMKALNPGSVNPAPANPSQLASRPIPSNITGANAPMSPPAMRPPVNAGIASGMQAQPALSPQVMQAAGGTMGNTVYAQRGRVPSGSVYNRGSDALEKALEMAREEGRLYSKSDRSLEGDLKNPFPEQELQRRAMLALLTYPAKAEDKARGGMGASAFASNGTQGRTVYAQFGYPTEKVSEASPGVVPLTREELREARNMGADSIERYHAEIARRQQAADFTRRGGPDFTYPHDPSASSGAELLAKEKTRKEMIGLGVNPDSPGALTALADAKQGEVAALEAAKRAEIERRASFSHPGGDLGLAFTEAQATQREGRRLEAQGETDRRIASLTPEEVGLTDRSGKPIMPPEKAFDYLLSQPDAMVRPHVGKAINDYFAGLPLGVHEENIEIKSNLLESLEGGVPLQEVLQKFEAAKGDILKSTENYSARMSQAFKDNVGVVNPQLMEGPLNKVRFLNRESSPGSVVNAFYDAQKEGLKGLELAPAHDAYAGGAGSGFEARRIAKRQVDSAVDPTNQESTFRPALEVNSGSGILTDPKTEVVSEVKDDEDAVAVSEADVDADVEATATADAVDAQPPSPEVIARRQQQTEQFNRRSDNYVSSVADPQRGDVSQEQLGVGFEPLGEVDIEGMREDLTGQLTEESNEHFQELRDQINELKEYDPRKSIQEIQAGRGSRIEQIKRDTNTQKLFAASAAFLGAPTFYEGFQKTMEEIGDLSKEEQKQVLALQDKMDETDLAARVAYAEHQAKMTDMEVNFLAARRADAQGNRKLAEEHIQTAIASRAAANDLKAAAAKNANARLALWIQQESIHHVKPTEAQQVAQQYINNVFVNSTEVERREFGFTPNATSPSQINLTVAAPKIQAYLDKVIPKSSSGGYAELNYRDRLSRDARSEIESIQTGFDKAWENAISAKSTLDLKRIEALTETAMPTLTEGSNMLAPSARRNPEIMAAVQDYMAWESYRRNRNNSAVTGEILRLYPNVAVIERRIANMNRAADEGGVEGGDGDPNTDRKPITEFN